MIQDTIDLAFTVDILPKLLPEIPTTIGMAVAAVIIGAVWGLLLAWCKLCRFSWLRHLTNTVTITLRGIPTVVMLFLVYFGLPPLLQRVGLQVDGWDKKIFVVLALAIELAVLTSEMFRSAYLALDRGQLEAAHALGMTKWSRFCRIILPQGFYVILPNMGSAVLGLVQGTALAYTLGVIDITGRAMIIDTEVVHMKTLEAFIAVAIIYWFLSVLITRGFKFLEKEFGKGMKTMGTSLEKA